MTSQWIVFGVVEPLVIVLIAWLGARWHLRSLRRENERSDTGDVFGSDLPDEVFAGVFEQPRGGMSVADRIDELEHTLAALIAGGSGWPDGLIDIAVKRLEAQIEMLSMSDDELREVSEQYQALSIHGIGTTSAAIMIELARRSTLTGHQRMAEAAERARMQEC